MTQSWMKKNFFRLCGILGGGLLLNQRRELFVIFMNDSKILRIVINPSAFIWVGSSLVKVGVPLVPFS